MGIGTIFIPAFIIVVMPLELGHSLCNWAKQLQDSNHPALAAACINEALSMNFKDLDMRYEHAKFFLKLRNYDVVRDDLGYAFEFHPETSRFLFLRAALQDQLGQKDKALADLRRARTLAPQELRTKAESDKAAVLKIHPN